MSTDSKELKACMLVRLALVRDFPGRRQPSRAGLKNCICSCYKIALASLPVRNKHYCVLSWGVGLSRLCRSMNRRHIIRRVNDFLTSSSEGRAAD